VPDKKKITTDEVAPGRFRPHGRVEFSTLGNILISEVIGPFNAELVNAVADTGVDQFQEFTRRGKWGDIIIFSGSAMASQEALAALTRNVSRNVNSGSHASATALVLAPDVEGAALMASHLMKCFIDGGYATLAIPISLFERYDEALSWIQSTLAKSV
jgi:hypothetical protein